MLNRKMKVGIIGGGPAGLTVAIGLISKGFEVFLFEADDYVRQRTGEHLAAEALHELKKLGIPLSILEENSIPCKEVRSAWGDAEIQTNESIFNPFGAGYILSRPSFDEALFQYCGELGVQVLKGVRVINVNQHGESWAVTTSKNSYSFDFIVDASGRNTKFKLNPYVQKVQTDQLVGISRSIELNASTATQDTFLLIEPTANGWWYSVQLQSSEFVMTFMTDASVLSKNKLTSEEFWEEQLKTAKYTNARVEGQNKIGKVSIQSAQSQKLSQLVGENWLSVGDAALSYDPLSSAGIIKGLKMGQLAAEKIVAFWNGNSEALTDYGNEMESQFKEYLRQQENYYSKESRWLNEPFWYHRNLRCKSLRHFTIHPEYKINVVDHTPNEKLEFLQKQIPETNFNALFRCIVDGMEAKDWIKGYLKHQGEMAMHPYLIHSLESLKLIGVIL